MKMLRIRFLENPICSLLLWKVLYCVGLSSPVLSGLKQLNYELGMAGSH